MHFNRASLAMIPLAMIASVSCSTLPESAGKKVATLDSMSKNMEEFGTVAMSSPQFARPSSDFNFDLKVGPDDFYAHAKSDVQGRASQLEQTVQSFGLSANVSLDPTVAASYLAALSEYQSTLAQNQKAQ